MEAREDGQLTLLDTFKQDFQANPEMQKTIKNELSLYDNGTTLTKTAIARNAICNAHQYQFVCAALYDTAIEYETEIEEKDNQINFLSAVVQKHEEKNGPLSKEALNQALESYKPIFLTVDAKGRNALIRIHRNSQLAREKLRQLQK